MLSVPEEESPLHHLHLRLCEWPASLIAAEMRSDTRFAAWVAKHLPPDLLEFVNASPRPEKLLSQSELRVLADVVDDAACFDNVLAKTWNLQPIPGYLDIRICLGEIASAMGIHAADDFAKRCARHIATLESRRMCLGEAIGVIADWISEIEDIQRAFAQRKTMPDKPALDAKALPPNKDVLYVDEAAIYLGLTVKRADNAMQRLIERGDLPRKIINGRLMFSRSDLDRLKAHGSRRSRRGRPPGSRNKARQV